MRPFRAPGLASLALVFALALVPAADAKRKTFRAVAKTPSALVFKPARIEPGKVRRAQLVLRKRGGDRAKRRIGARRVRAALKRGVKLRVHRPARVRGGRLIVTTPDGPVNCRVPHPTLRAHAPASTCWRPYSEDSPFNRPVTPDARVVSNSQAIVDRWVGFGSLNAPKFNTGTAGTSYDYEHPIYYSSRRDPIYEVRCQQWVSSCEVHGMRVRIPSRAKPAAGSDGHLTVIDARSGWEYDFWQVTGKPRGGGALKVGHGGRTELGGDGLDSNATAAHFGLAAGVIRPEELAAGEINHALFMVVNCTNGTSVAPAHAGTSGRSCSSIGQSNANAPRMGEHFVLDMTDAEINALPTAAWRKTILRAMAHYGLYVGDTGGGFLKLQSGASWTSFGRTDPWRKLGNKLDVPTWSEGGRTFHAFDLRSTIDWRSRMEIVDPCVAQGTC